MKWAMLLIAMVAGLGLGSQQPEAKTESGAPSQPPAVTTGTRFKAVDIVLDTGESLLGAYQVEIVAKAGGTPALPGKITLVGVEGGDHAAFKSAPHYDPAALHEDQLKDRIILAAFNTGADLPKGKIRIARIHIQVEGADPTYTVTVKAAASADGTRFDATATAGASGDSR